MHTYIRLTFWLLFSVVELVLFCAHICMMPFTCLGGAGLILDGMKCIFLIFLGTILSVLHYLLFYFPPRRSCLHFHLRLSPPLSLPLAFHPKCNSLACSRSQTDTFPLSFS